jgi:ABC-2 type transport system permease protein
MSTTNNPTPPIETAPSPASNSVPSSMTQVGVILKYTFLDYLRSRRFLLLLIIGLVIAALLTFVVAYKRPEQFLSDSLGFYANWWGMTATFVVILSGVFFGGDAISSEFQNKTGYFTVPNPIRRSSIYVGKWLAAFIASSIILAIFAFIAIVNNLYYFGANFPWQFGESLLFSWIYLATVLGFTFLFSSLFKSSSYSILVTLILFLFGFTVIQELVAVFAGIEPWFIVTYGSGIIGDILMSPYPVHEVVASATGAGGRSFTLTTFNPTVPEGIVIMLAYFIATAIIGLVLFERKEFN